MKNRVLVLATVCLHCGTWLSFGGSHAGETKHDVGQPSLQAMLLGEVAMPSEPAADKDEPKAVPDEEEDLPGFDTPEQAVVAYLVGLKNAALEQMLSACTTDTFADQRDFALLLGRRKIFPIISDDVPNTNSFLRDVSFEIRRADLAKAIIFQYVTILIPELNVNGLTLRLKNEEEISEFLTLFDENRLDKLASLTILEVMKMSDWMAIMEGYRTKENMENMMQRARIHGADDFDNVVVSFRVDGQDFLFFPMVCRFGNKWLITDLMSNVTNLFSLSTYSGGVLKEK